MNIKEIQDLIKFVAKSGASEVKLEMDDLEKNKLSDYTIHNYEMIGGRDTLDSVCVVDRKIIDSYLYSRISNSDEEE